MRANASTLITQVVKEQRSLSSLLSDAPPLVKELCYGCLRWYYPLDIIAKTLLHSPLKPKDQDVYHLILLGFYQLAFMNIPPYAVISETVEAARQLKKSWGCGLINKLLRKFQQQQTTLLTAAKSTPVGLYSHPLWLIEKIQRAWPTQWQSILNANNSHPPMTLRVNRQQCSRQDYLDQLAQNQIDAHTINDLDDAITLARPLPVNELPGFTQGLCSVQDESGQHVVKLLALEPNQRVLDACAAPGSKTGHILEAQPLLEKLIAIDKDPSRLPKISENILRLKLPQEKLSLVVADVGDTKQWWDNQLFDRILLDAPCSATGVIRRHPDIKLLRKPQDIPEQVIMQQQLLHALWPLLKSGGRLIYTTCSVLPEENENVIEDFLHSHNDAKVIPIHLNIGITQSHGVQLLPQENSHDGFYYCILKKGMDA